jgi:fibronectin-binding autotransporter adhesin
VRAVSTLVAAVAVGLLVPSPGTAATFKVNCATQSLATRIAAVPAGSVILVKGTCSQIEIGKNITIAGNPTATITGGGLERAVTISGSPMVRLTDLTITGGKVTGSLAKGGGILHPGGLLVLRRTVVTGNLAEANVLVGALAEGGGIYSSGGVVRLIHSALRKNTARGIAGTGASAYGGGIIHGGNLVVDHSTVSGNRARAEASAASGALAGGGGIFAMNGTIAVTSSKVNGNVATASGAGAATYAQGYAGGIEVTGATLFTLAKSTVSKNQALSDLVGGTSTAQGAGLDASSSKIAIRNTVFAGNLARATSPGSATTSAYGAGAHIQDSTGVSVARSRLTGGRVVATTSGTAGGSGAGISLSATAITLSGTLVGSNTIAATAGSGPATAEGAGLVLRSGSKLQLVRSTVRANRADSTAPGVAVSSGGGIASLSSELAVRASTLNGNVAGTSGQALGGGIFLAAGGPHTVASSTLAGNRATGATARGGGIDVDTTLAVTAATLARNSARLGGGIYVEGGTTTLRASLLGLNTATMSGADCSQSVASAGRNLVASTIGCAFAAMGTDKTGLAPKLALLKSNGGPTQTIALLGRSPALNAIPKAECPFARDQRGVRRPQGPRCDIGAYEKKT